MIRRDFLKFLGAGVASLPMIGKLFKEGAPEMKAVTKNVIRSLPRVKGMPEWFSPLVNKIMKEGVDITPKASRVEDIEIVKKLEIPSKTGQPETFTLTENKATGRITIESNTGGIGDSPFEINYHPPKSNIDVETGKVIKEPGDFYVAESRPKPDYNFPGKVEYDYETFSLNDAHSDVEKLEKLATGKIKNAKQAEQRSLNRKRTEEYPYEDIMDRYPDPDFADGGIASFQYGGGSIGYSNGGLAPITYRMPISPGYAGGGYISRGEPVNTDLTRTIPPDRGPDPQGVETLFKRRYS